MMNSIRFSIVLGLALVGCAACQGEEPDGHDPDPPGASQSSTETFEGETVGTPIPVDTPSEPPPPAEEEGEFEIDTREGEEATVEAPLLFGTGAAMPKPPRPGKSSTPSGLPRVPGVLRGGEALPTT